MYIVGDPTNAAYDDGRAALLLLLDGTLPAEYGGVVYYIPVHIWIPRAYPREAPTVYVMPTKDMLVRRSAYVDPSGRVYAEYMQQWERKPEGADILDLLRACQGHFGQEPPVVAKPTAAGPSQVAAQPPPATGPSHAPPLPKKAEAPASPASPRAPQRPPKPGAERAAPEAPRPAAQPARPPNPELAALHDAVYTKFRTRRDELRHSVSQANAQLRVLLDDLERGQPAIQDEMQRLEAVQAVCNTRTHQLNDTMQAAQSRAHELQLRPEPNVDEMFAATNLVENQLVQLVAEDHAIEDTLYQLGRALHAEQLSLDRFIKVRPPPHSHSKRACFRANSFCGVHSPKRLCTALAGHSYDWANLRAAGELCVSRATYLDRLDANGRQRQLSVAHDKVAALRA